MKGLVKPVISLVVVAVLLICVVLYVPAQNGQSVRPISLLKKWKDCMLTNAEEFKGKYEEAWNNGWKRVMKKCGHQLPPRLNVTALRNNDETKYHILPKLKSTSTIVTLGVGRDIEAEKRLRSVLGKDNVEFFGADPIYDENGQLYSEVGKYFPFAVSATAGFSTASVYINGLYVDKQVVNVDLIYFLTKIINRKFYDAIWMDAEHAEYGLFPHLLKGGQLDQNGVIVCQWNMEIHNPDLPKKKLTHDFLFQTIRDQRYGFKHLINVGHYRLFLLNLEDERCLEKYIPKDF